MDKLKRFNNNIDSKFNNNISNPFKAYKKVNNFNENNFHVNIMNFTTKKNLLENINKEEINLNVSNVIKLNNGATIYTDITGNKYVDTFGNIYLLNDNGGVIKCLNSEMSNIFNDENNKKRQFGGNQELFKENITQLLENKDIRKILESNFPNASEEDYALYLNKLKLVGCGYTAFANSIFKQFSGKEKEFKKKFGIDMYRLNENNEMVFNYEPLILDAFTYFWHDYEQNEDIKKLCEEASEETIRKYQMGEKVENALGCNSDTYFMLTNYIYNHQIDCEYDNQKNKNWIYENIDVLNSKEKSIIVSASNYDMYKIDSNTNNKGELFVENGEGHAMSLVDVKENGDLIVSSWGNKYILDISDPSCDCEFQIYDFKKQ